MNNASMSNNVACRIKERSVALIVSIAALQVAGCAIMPKVLPVASVNTESKAGVVYSLPRTLITVDVPLKQVSRQPGILLPLRNVTDWENYAKTLRTKLGIEPHEIILTKYTKYSVVNDGVSIGTTAVPDKDATFYAEMQADGLQELKLDLTFGAKSILVKADVSATNQVLPLVGKVGETLIATAGKTLAIKAASVPFTDPAVTAAIDEIIDIREKRWDALNKPALDSAVVLLLLEELKQRETRLLANLVGTEEIKLWTLKAEIDPPQNAVGSISEILLKLHDGAGVEIASNGKNRSQSPFPTATNPNPFAPDVFEERSPTLPPNVIHPTPTTNAIALNLDPKPLLFQSNNFPKVSDGSLYYRVPRDATAEVTSYGASSKVISLKEVTIAQLGNIRQLPRRLGGVSGGYVVTLDDSTGGLKSISSTSKPLDAAAQFSALASKYAEKEKGDEELSSLERQKKLLEYQKAIKDLQAALAQ